MYWLTFLLMKFARNRVLLQQLKSFSCLVARYGVFSDPYFPVFELNTECIQSECRKIRTRKNSIFGHFSRSVLMHWLTLSFASTIFCWDVFAVILFLVSRLSICLELYRLKFLSTIFLFHFQYQVQRDCY